MSRTGLCLALLLGSCAICTVAQPAAFQFLDESIDQEFAVSGTVKVGTWAELAFNYQDDRNYYSLKLTPRGARFAKVLNGKATPLGTWAKIGPLKPDDEQQFTLQRGVWRMWCVLGTQVVARAWDEQFANGKVGYRADQGEWSDVALQNIERSQIHFSDNHMRKASSLGSWEVVAGSWKTKSLEEEDAGKRKAELSANAFSLMARTEDKALTVTSNSYWFWSDYQCQTAVYSHDNGPVGIVFYYQDPDNYLLFRWTSRVAPPPDGNRAQIVEVVDGASTVLAEKPGGFLPLQWYTIRAAVADGIVRCYVDDQLVVAARTNRFGQGQFGLYAEHTRNTTFDDALLTTYDAMTEGFDAQAPGKWQALGADWQISGGAARPPRTGRSALVTGNRNWHDYVWAADVTLPRHGGVGLVVARQQDRYVALRYGGSRVDYAGKLQLVQVAGDQVQVLDETAEPKLSPKKAIRLKAVIDGPVAIGYVNGEPAVEAVVLPGLVGQPGLYAENAPGAAFDDCYLAFTPPPHKAVVPEEFQDTKTHFEMAEWSDPHKAPWIIPAEGAKDPTFYSKGDYYGDTDLEVKLEGIGQRAGTFTARLAAKQGDPESGIALTISATTGSRVLKARLTAGKALLAETEVEAPAETATLKLQRKGDFVLAYLQDKCFLQYRLGSH